jgi:Ca2+-binding RTX toxin-like protein
MTYTFDKSSGTDATLETRLGVGDDVTTIYAANGIDVIATLNFEAYRFLNRAPANWSVASATTSDTLIATDSNDFIFWDLGTTNGIATGNPDNRVADTSVRARLYNGADERDFEIFDLRAGNDILNLTYADAGSSPGSYASSATVYGGSGNDTLALSSGADYVYGGADSDFIYGGGGLDRLWGDAGSSALDEAAGSADTITSSNSANATLWGEGGNDVLAGSGDGIETFYGGAGNDTIDNVSGFGDVAYGASGNDRIITADTAYGGTGNDWIDGGFGGTGVEGRDTIFGDEGNDTLFGYDANDKLYGGANADTLFGGSENDELYFNADSSTSGSVRLWDGASGSSFSLALSGTSYSFDTFFGDDGIDTLVLDDNDDVFVNSPGDLNTGSGFGPGGVNRLAGIEIVLAGAGADIIGLNHQNTGGGDSASIYSQNITIAGEDGNDVIVSGSGADLLIGGRLGTGAGTGNDTIFGGANNDVIYGDSRANDGSSVGSGNDLLFGGAGNDTIYGGEGDDTIFAGAGDDYAYGGLGNDTIFDEGSSNGLFSAAGSDLTILTPNNAGLNKSHSVTGLDEFIDGDDRVFVVGAYASVSFSLGAGNDWYVSDATAGAGIDRVSGQSGNDVISTWQGDDFIDGGADTDALWGGAGADTIYGGAATDYLYGGAGDGDVLVGGPGIDYYYWSRTDGDDLIMDGDSGGVNALIVFPDFDKSEVTAGSDQLRNGSGVLETDHDLYDDVGGDDMVMLRNTGGTQYELTITNGLGEDNVIAFDQTDISVIALWNNDAAPGTPVIQQYVWDADLGEYKYWG